MLPGPLGVVGLEVVPQRGLVVGDLSLVLINFSASDQDMQCEVCVVATFLQNEKASHPR